MGRFDETVSFKLHKDGEDKVRTVLKAVYEALEEKGYNPINQLIGYMISGDPAYITSHNNARSLICKIERDEILEVLLRNYLQEK
ncbi:IreB family regulatory phosphoprotein [Thermosyntropha sp.]|uniref:IreB family regulatory phosphoprotein n=1 Tax=Thermosyntropha sp. TaxID=2740820 RepID=UPI0025D568AB|nr:IreB family regulatory phosphoprotein [Thermosyntropha sp.]MBO8159812.1 IreB family regulatory phosphoprotein [Thermosyntropha sp.]